MMVSCSLVSIFNVIFRSQKAGYLVIVSRAVAPTPAGPRHRFVHAQITLFAKLDVGRANPQLKQLSGAGKSMIAQ